MEFILENQSIIRNKDMELFSILMENCIRDCLKMISNMEMDFKSFQMDQSTKDNLDRVLKMGKELFNGIMAKFMKVNGLMVKNMEVACGKVLKDKVIQGNGKMAQSKVLEFIYQKMEIAMKGNLKTRKNKVSAPKDIRTAKHMLVSIEKIGQTAKDNIFGQMEITTKVNLSII